MGISVLILFQNHSSQPLDAYQGCQRELQIAALAEPLGSNSVWAVEHPSTDHTLCPNPFKMLCCPGLGDTASAAHEAIEPNPIAHRLGATAVTV